MYWYLEMSKKVCGFTDVLYIKHTKNVHVIYVKAKPGSKLTHHTPIVCRCCVIIVLFICIHTSIMPFERHVRVKWLWKSKYLGMHLQYLQPIAYNLTKYYV